MAIQIGGNVTIGGGIFIGDFPAIPPPPFFVTEVTQDQLITEDDQLLIAE